MGCYVKRFFIICFTISISCLGYGQTQNIKVYNIKSFGAKGDGIADDTEAIQRCFNLAVKSLNAKIVIPYGKYKLRRALVLNYVEGTKEILGEQQNKTNPTFVSSSLTDILVARGYLFKNAASIFKIKNVTLVGKNLPFSNAHPKINKADWSAALLIYDKKQANIENVVVKDFYGQGIHISTTKQEGIPVSACFQYAEVLNSKILNVWGYNPQNDSYGDGIYMSNVRRGKISNNYINNKLSQTGQLGRSGLVVEYMCKDILISNNLVEEGYDRALHVEETDGGHRIINNKLLGSDLGFVLVEGNQQTSYKSLTFQGNYISNKNLRMLKTVKKTYARANFGDRSLLFIDTKKLLGSPQINITDNTFQIDGTFEYDSNVIFNNRSDYVILSDNRFEAKGTAKNFLIANFSKIENGNGWKNKVVKVQ
ncbi:glycosyl hydrolase family 28-related protein [Pedobacter suwonensis]|uniref:glycosyl hydrolase family 28-related protein n=1 Tax=Pedobacter suwonensis TaxID=332999 RepID=UPI0025E6569B|nr:glycosyl hydrolase family 28-related protein [uncultured Pedobacter sp.]